jgi:valyl-tRNA synthetase
MEKSFDPKSIESRWYPLWEASGAFRPKGQGEPYCIQLPPPNVTGTLHMGHAFQQTIMDLLVRYHRMLGKDVLWQVGTDHAGIATQKIVENQLAAQGLTRQGLGREAFLERVWQWKEQSGSTITRQMRRLGASGDWTRERFTMDPGLSEAVRKVFVDWYRAGLIYRGKRLVHWDPVLMTAVSDLEVENTERAGSMWSIRYPGVDGSEGVVVATTRPETMLGDVAVAVHPDDERYQHLIGKHVQLPLCDRSIPVLADAFVDREFGTGVVKITPAHDFNDFELGKRHGLTPLTILALDGRINESAPERYQGLERFEARKRVLADLVELGLLVETREHKLSLPISQRSDAITEPMLTDQWFVDLTRDSLPDGRPGGRTAIVSPALQAVTSGAIRFVPENWSTVYVQWLSNIQDWCISRQLWWGHRIPAWYDEAGNIFVGHNEADAIAASELKPIGELRQDLDVLDTWFSSALWPFSTLGWPGSSDQDEWQRMQRFLPSSVLVTGFDIIFFWVARMVMSSCYFTGRVPFREVYINAIVRDAEGQKMSKSKGNTIDPLDLVDGIELEALVANSTAALLNPKDKEKVEKRIRKDYPQGITGVGADALRFTFAAQASFARTISFDLKRCEGYKAFCNKLWNAARFVLMNVGEASFAGQPPLKSTSERWIAGALEQTAQTVHRELAAYRFDLAAQALYDFAWNEYCDWFLELTKPVLAGEDQELKRSAMHTLLYVLDGTLKLLHPMIPFISSEIWDSLAPRLGHSGMLCDAQLPAQFASVDVAADRDIAWLKEALTGLRRIRSELNVAPSRAVRLMVQGGSEQDQALINAYQSAIRFLARIDAIEVLPSDATAEPNALALVGSLRLMVPLAGLIDLGAERARLDKELGRLALEIQKCERKLATESFVASAPAAVVEQERARLRDFTAKHSQLGAQRMSLG